MQAFIKDAGTFATKGLKLVLDYDLKESIYDTVSTIGVEASPVSEGDFVYLEGADHLGIVKTVATTDEKMELKCRQPATFFARQLFYEAEAFTYAEDYLKALIDRHYTNCSDDLYAFPYLSVICDTHTAIQIVPDVDGNTFTIQSYISKLRRVLGIRLRFVPTRTTLEIHIEKVSPATKKVDLSNPRYKVIEESFAEKYVGKITTYCKESTKQQNWYANDDGTVDSDPEEDGALWCLQHQDLTYSGITVTSWTSWTPDSTHEGYGYYADITARGATPAHVPELVLDAGASDVDAICPITTAQNGTVRIYASSSTATAVIEELNLKLQR